MKIKDWLLLCYIFKWAHFWVAPTWMFIALWFFFVVGVAMELVKNTRIKYQ